MKIVLDENGYVYSYALIGDISNSVEVSDPVNPEDFAETYSCYKYENGTLMFDQAKYNDEFSVEKLIDELRELREKECFSYIDRSVLWYYNLTEEERSELTEWYNAWLNVTDTLDIPEKPSWLH